MNAKMQLSGRVKRFFQGLHVFGIVLGVLFFAASLTPSLLPRPPLIQGILSGLALSLGYGLGILCVEVWRYLQLPVATNQTSEVMLRIAIMLSVMPMSYSVWRAAKWQNSIRTLMGLDPLDSVQPLYLCVVAFGMFVMLLAMARLFRTMLRFSSTKLERFFRPRLARLLGLAACLWVCWAISEGIIVRYAMRAIDRSFQQLDALMDDDLPVPTAAIQTGSPESLISWESLGNQGRKFISDGPSASDLEAFFRQPCAQPIRVYVGLNSADSAQERAVLALNELIRVRAFERSVLILATPTGTGWIDPACQNPLEYLHRGDIATVAVQYSYLNSPLALLTEAAYGATTAEAVFNAIYGYWRTLPRHARPRLFLNGLSLGSLNSDLSFQLFDVVDDPFDGALWCGPPFLHPTWKQATHQRQSGSPVWEPRIRNGTVIRFMTQGGNLAQAGETWGTFRIAFLQYASDPITFFDPRSAWQKPEWMNAPRGADVSSELTWFPVVTMLQLAADMIVGTAPPGFGHNYAAHDYIRAWLGLTEPQGWSSQELERLHRLFEKTQTASYGAP
ncbi:MAG: alpha/beta-hydrolase family protein [Pirellulaceae bacterium]|nr:alpha/beta-hydrolase family protein [Pirellulaceae bacterium]